MNVSMKRASSQVGFSLIELMIVIVIVGVLAAIALPSYQSSVRESRRTEAKTELLDAMARQEQYFSENLAYAANFSDLDLGSWGSGKPTENDYYRMNITVVTSTNTVSIIAVAQGSQVEDLVNTYRISSNGLKSWDSDDGNHTGWK